MSKVAQTRLTTPAQRRRGTLGTVALEFALLGSAVLTLILGTMEIAYLLYAQIALDYATATAARNLFTGQMTIRNGLAQSGFQEVDFCGYLSPLISCADVKLFLQPVTNYQTTLQNQTVPAANSTINPGASGSYMLLQAYWASPLPIWPLNVPMLVSSSAYANEF